MGPTRSTGPTYWSVAAALLAVSFAQPNPSYTTSSSRLYLGCIALVCSSGIISSIIGTGISIISVTIPLTFLPNPSSTSFYTSSSRLYLVCIGQNYQHYSPAQCSPFFPPSPLQHPSTVPSCPPPPPAKHPQLNIRHMVD